MFIYQRVQHITTQLHILQPYELKTTRPCGPPNHISPHVHPCTQFHHFPALSLVPQHYPVPGFNRTKPEKVLFLYCLLLLRFFGILWLGIVFYLCCQNIQVLNYLREVGFSSFHMSLDHFLLGQDPDLPGLPMSVMMMVMTMTMRTMLIMMLLMMMMVVMMMMAWLIVQWGCSIYSVCKP